MSIFVALTDALLFTVPPPTITPTQRAHSSEAPGVDVNAVDKTGITPLSAAVHYAAIGGMNVLRGAPNISVNIADCEGETALHIAAAVHNRDETMSTLLEAPGIDVNAVDNKGMTPLSTAVISCCVISVKLLLRAPNTNVNMANIEGDTALSLGLANDFPAISVLQASS